MGDTERLMKREISFILQFRESEPEFCTRYLFYRNANIFRQNLISSIPFRIDIGAEFNLYLKNREAKIALNAVRREYIIDIDMNDYDGIRTCCTGKKLCNSCWTFMEAAYKVLREVLYEVFGFQKILWVFSGRRGMHAWVCDASAMDLESSQRKSITNFLNVAVNNEKSDRLVTEESLSKMSSVRLFGLCRKILLPYEKFLFTEQNFFAHPRVGQQNYERVLKVLKRYYREHGMDFTIGHFMKVRADILASGETAAEDRSLQMFHDMITRFRVDIDEFNRKQTDKKAMLDLGELTKKFRFEIIVGFLYPKIDSAVSSHTNHLLKAPFNIHSSSLLLSVPVNPEKFDIDLIPSIQDIISGKASMVEYVEHFRMFVNGLRREQRPAEKSDVNGVGKLERAENKKVHI